MPSHAPALSALTALLLLVPSAAHADAIKSHNHVDRGRPSRNMSGRQLRDAQKVVDATYGKGRITLRAGQETYMRVRQPNGKVKKVGDGFRAVGDGVPSGSYVGGVFERGGHVTELHRGILVGRRFTVSTDIFARISPERDAGRRPIRLVNWNSGKTERHPTLRGIERKQQQAGKSLGARLLGW